MPNDKFDWSYFKRRIYIKNCSKSELFKKWTTSNGLSEWFIAEAIYKNAEGKIRGPNEIVQKNDTYQWKFHIGTVISGKILEVREDLEFTFTFGEKKEKTGENIIVTVLFYDENDLIWFDIIQKNMPITKQGKVNYYISCNMGWVFHMNNLKSIYETGHDLRVKGENRMHVDAPSGYSLEKYSWTNFRYDEYIRAPLEDLFHKLATSEGITQWFIAKATYENNQGYVRKPDEFLQSGDNYTWKFYAGLEIKGKILEIIKNKLIKFTFGKKEPESDEDVIVTIFLKDEGKFTKIHLLQEDIADNDYGHVSYNLSCILGWSYFLTNLRSIYESGYDLREKNSNIAKESRSYSLEI